DRHRPGRRHQGHRPHSPLRPRSPRPMKRLRLLVVEDEPSTRAELAGQLAEQPTVGEVVCADGGGEAVRLLGSGRFDAVFLDIAMPGIDGMDVARILTRLSDAPAIVFVTAYDNHAVDAFGLGAV